MTRSRDLTQLAGFMILRFAEGRIETFGKDREPSYAKR